MFNLEEIDHINGVVNDLFKSGRVVLIYINRKPYFLDEIFTTPSGDIEAISFMPYSEKWVFDEAVASRILPQHFFSAETYYIVTDVTYIMWNSIKYWTLNSAFHEEYILWPIKTDVFGVTEYELKLRSELYNSGALVPVSEVYDIVR